MAVDTSTVQVVMPAMGDSVAEGTVLEWHKQEGDTVAADETLVEISTDKVDAEVPAPAAGTLVKIHAAEGDTVAVGALLAEIATDAPGATATAPAPGRRPGSADAPRHPGRDAAAADAAATDGERAAQPADRAETIDIVTPTGGESVTEGTILEWAVKVGDAVKDGDTVVEISTDKVDMELPAPASGTITEILAEEGETVTVGQVIAPMSAGAGAPAAPAPPAPAAPPRPRAGGRRRPRPPRRRRRRANASPVARRVAAAEGVDLGRVQGSARGGRITKADVLAAAGNGARRHGRRADGAPQAAAGGQARGRQLIKGGAAALARYMDQSRSIPTATSFRTLTVTVLDERRKQLKDGRPAGLVHPSDRLRDRPRGHRRDAGDGPPLRRDRRQAPPHRRRRGQPRPRRRRGEEGRHPHADGAGDPRRRPPELRASSSTPTTRWSRRRAPTR